mgnify:CR=1 FL=1
MLNNGVPLDVREIALRLERGASRSMFSLWFLQTGFLATVTFTLFA